MNLVSRSGIICSDPFVGRTVKSDAKGAETGKELGPLMQQMDHERTRNRHCLQKHLTFATYTASSETYTEGGGRKGPILWYNYSSFF